MATEEGMKLMSSYIPNSAHKAKKMLGLSWRGLILRGIESCGKGDEQSLTAMKEQMLKMSQKMQTLALRCYKLEQASEELKE